MGNFACAFLEILVHKKELIEKSLEVLREAVFMCIR